MTVGVFCDLDGNLIYSGRRVANPEGLVIAQANAGVPKAWMTPTAARGLQEIRERAVFVPTTTRSLEQYQRVSLPGGADQVAIIANGARLIIDGVEDSEWAQARLDPSWGASPAATVIGTFDRVLGEASWYAKSENYDSIISVSANPGQPFPDAALETVTDIATDHGYTVYLRGNKASVFPSHITKEAAAEEIRTRLGLTRTIAAGDFHHDTGIMTWADDAIQPAHGVAAPGIRQTRAHGVEAGEEIVDAFLAFLNASQ
ncbi:hypothetical protein [Microbacterium sp. 77mftsu3.1]|uniref:hypothetical protein n=1 Tax=Microbacterium sp. 77mftsu3.1 TaxID=1761802 RepID=UPI000373D54F|nr:hypothetical protein [Microbacterium sp. 77mftsu3.1]SDH49155.1 hypothetical protein SAMN04488590_3430 [Microbacterium sp. 77mftsu3.1]